MNLMYRQQWILRTNFILVSWLHKSNVSKIRYDSVFLYWFSDIYDIFCISETHCVQIRFHNSFYDTSNLCICILNYFQFYEGFQLTYSPSKRRLQMLKLLRFFKWEIHLPVKTCQSVFEIFYEWPSIHCCVIYHSCISELFRIFNLCTLVNIHL